MAELVAETVGAEPGGRLAANHVASLTGAAPPCRRLLERDPGVLCAAVDAYAASPACWSRR